MERGEIYELLALANSDRSATHRLQQMTDYVLDQLCIIQYCEQQFEEEQHGAV